MSSNLTPSAAKLVNMYKDPMNVYVDDHLVIDRWRRACDWDGDGKPPAMVVMSDGSLFTLLFEYDGSPLELVPVVKDDR